MSDIFQRKRDHLALCTDGPVHGADHHGLFEEVQLVHCALPELATEQLDLGARLLDHPLKAPLMVTGMTGGPPEAGEINRTLAAACAAAGIAFGVGSQRIITKAAGTAETFTVRAAAPDVVLCGNLGVNQIRDLGVARAAALMQRIEADCLCVHLNAAQELAQPGGEADSDFRHGYATIGRLVEALDGRVIVKECGTGLAPSVVARLHGLGVRAVDVSGSGGTSWVKVEALRADGVQADLGMLFQGWGIPTAAATALSAGIGPQIIASGGIVDPLQAAKALALGADLVGSARPVLQAYASAGREGVDRFIALMIRGLKMALLLTGSRTIADLRRAPRIVGPRLKAWIEQGRGA